MVNYWGYAPPGLAAGLGPVTPWPGVGAGPAVGWEPAMPYRRRRQGRLGRAGVLGLAGFVAWMLVGSWVLGAGTHRPAFFLVGWDLVLGTLELGGWALQAFRLALGGLWVVVPLWAATGGFRRGSWWRPLASLGVGLAGLAAAVPLMLVATVVAANLVLWSMIVVFGLLLCMALLFRLLTAPLRRW
jgi:hypothetical protein